MMLSMAVPATTRSLAMTVTIRSMAVPATISWWVKTETMSITGGAGDDTIDGGADNDIAIFAGNQADYTFESSADGLTVTITDTVNNDVDTVTGVETLRFDDGDIAVSLDTSLNQLVLTGDIAADNITIVGSVPVTVYGDEGDNIIVGGSGGAGNDTPSRLVRVMIRLMAVMVMTPSRLVRVMIRSKAVMVTTISMAGAEMMLSMAVPVTTDTVYDGDDTIDGRCR